MLTTLLTKTKVAGRLVHPTLLDNEQGMDKVRQG